jgi:hypothetical protein
MVGNTAWITHALRVVGWVTFWSKKISLKHINMGSSFEDLVVTSLTAKTVRKLDKRFDLKKTF